MSKRRTRAVSHVVAVALLVAIVTILAGTIAVYLGSFGGLGGDTTPNVVIKTAFNESFETNGQYLNLTHDGGDTVHTAQVRISVTGAETVAPTGSARIESDVIEAQVGSEWKVTETIVIDRRAFKNSTGHNLTGGTNLRLEDAIVRIVYEHQGEERTSIMYECEVASPDCKNREN